MRLLIRTIHANLMCKIKTMERGVFDAFQQYKNLKQKKSGSGKW